MDKELMELWRRLILKLAETNDQVDERTVYNLSFNFSVDGEIVQLGDTNLTKVLTVPTPEEELRECHRYFQKH